MTHPTGPLYPSRPWRTAGAALLTLAPAALLVAVLLQLAGHAAVSGLALLIAIAATGGALACANRAARIDSDHLVAEED